MNTAVVTQPMPASSRRPRGRLTGVVYLMFFLTAIASQLLTSRNLAFAGTAVNLISIGFYLALMVLFYGMFKPVNRRISLLAALFNLAGCIVMTVGLIYPTLLPISPLWFFGTLLPFDRLPRAEINLPAPDSGRIHGLSRRGLAGVSHPGRCTPSNHLHRGPRHLR